MPRRQTTGSTSKTTVAAAPPEVVDPISGQISQRVKLLRQQRGWSLEQLATASGVSKSMLSQIERNQANPTLAVTCKIAQAFGMSLAEFVEVTSASSAIHVIRADDHEHLYRSDEFVEIRTLSPLNLEKDVEFYQVRLKFGGALRSAPHFQGTREFLTVEQGRVRIEDQVIEEQNAKRDPIHNPAENPKNPPLGIKSPSVA